MEEQDFKTYTEKQEPYAAPVYTEPPKKKSNVWIIVLIILLVLFCCLVVVGAVVGFLIYTDQYRIEWSMIIPLLSLI